ncbi:MAG: methionine--tRNA ligase [Candidatus Acidiferrales bacterium]
MDKPKFYLTTPIYYVNARPHLGHTYTTIVADTIARYKRMCGYDVVLLTGTDEHGQKVERAAKAAGVSPQAYADRISQEYRTLWKELDLSIDRFIRTTEPRQERAVHRLLLQAKDNGYIYKGHYEGQYCVFDEMYVDEPLPGGLCSECKRPTERIREENYYFKLSAFQDRLLDLYAKQPDFVQPETRRNEVIAFVRGGLRDLSVSRTTIKWGIPWPDDEKHVIYVWYDALTSYMTGVGYGDDELQWEKYWPADLHLIGKEILRFHAVYWPAFLMAADEPLPKKVFAHGWWLFADEKMSKSRGNMQYPQPIARTLGIDALRYFLLREMVFGQDGNFSRDALLTRYNSDLANGLGNLASRTLTMIANYCGSGIPDSHEDSVPNHDDLVQRFYSQRLQEIRAAYEKLQFSIALERIWDLTAAVDKYLVIEKPWTLAGDPSQKDHLERILYDAAESIRIVSVLAHPVLPHATQRIWEQLGQRGSVSQQRIEQLQWGGLKPGTLIGQPAAIFPRVDKNEAFERIEAMEDEIRSPEGAAKSASAAASASAGLPVAAAPAAAAAAAPAASSKISIEDFAKVEMRVGVVKSAEKIPGADKILKVLVDIGEEVRQVVAGIAEAYKPEELIGKKVVIVANLAPRKLRGVESNGMIVAASVGPEGKPVLCTFTEDVPPGARLK